MHSDETVYSRKTSCRDNTYTAWHNSLSAHKIGGNVCAHLASVLTSSNRNLCRIVCAIFAIISFNVKRREREI